MERISAIRRALGQLLIADIVPKPDNPFPGCDISCEVNPGDTTEVRFVLTGPWTDRDAAIDALAEFIRSMK